MRDPGIAAAIARAFELGREGRLPDGPVARGNQGRIWRLDTDSGGSAVKQSFRPWAGSDVRDSALFQEARTRVGVRCLVRRENRSTTPPRRAERHPAGHRLTWPAEK
jgi:hypothetical protein